MSTESRAWWDRCHKENRRLYLAGSKGNEVWNFLGVNHLIKLGAVVLDIGVGFGYEAIDLSRKGCIVHALDISETALDRVKEWVICCWRAPEQLKDLPENTFDLAVSFLVAQHLSDADLLEQLAAVIKSLKPNGVFAMQFAFNLGSNPTKTGEISESLDDQELLGIIYNRLMKENKRDFEAQTHGAVCRSLEEVKQMVCKANGEVVKVTEERFPAKRCGWYGVHIKKKVVN